MPLIQFEIRGKDMYGAQIFHAVKHDAPVAFGDIQWVMSSHGAAGIIYTHRESIITHLADMIGRQELWSVDFLPHSTDERAAERPVMINIDRSGGVWLDAPGKLDNGRDYLDPTRYLPRLIPES